MHRRRKSIFKMAEEEKGKTEEENGKTEKENGNGKAEDAFEKEVLRAEEKRREKEQIGDEKGVFGAEIVEEMEQAFIDYAMSVIVDRALPSVEDGLKPVHRRILYAMHTLGLDFSKPTRKSATVVGEVIGKYHPHGDIAVYDTLVRLAQTFSLRYPLIHGQGNFGCFTADTKVALADGRDVSFAELIEEQSTGKRNFTFTVDNGAVKIAEIKNPRKTRENAEIMEVLLDNGEKIRCTLNHKFMLRDETYKEAQYLNSGDSLMPLYKELLPKFFFEDNNFNLQNVVSAPLAINHKVVDVKFLNKFVDVYDITVDKTHNFALASGIFVHNSMDGDSAAAQRYTEAKLSKISAELLEDIEKGTVVMRPNFDNSLKEPETLPAKLPNLLLNGATGIAVGMATNIPPHNLTELTNAIIFYIENPNTTVEDLIGIVKGPDFPTGGLITGPGIKEMYRVGKGKVVIRARSEIEEDSKGKSSIILTEIPYLVNKADLVKNIARLATEKKLPDISDLRDESAKGKVRVVIELKKGVDPKFTLNQLYKMTNIQTSFDANLLALVGKQPRVLNLLDIIREYVKYRQLVVRRRSDFELNKAQERIELVLGLLLALKNIDEIVIFIKKSTDTKSAHEGLMKKFGMTDRQAKAVLEIKLQQLTHLEAEKLKDEEKKLKGVISELERILGDEKEILKVIKSEVKEINTKFGDNRRTKVIRNVDEITEQDLIEKKEVVVMVTNSGYIKRVDMKSYKEQKRGGVGVTGADLKEEDFVTKLITCSTHDHLLFFTSRGRLYWLKANDAPASERQGKGKAIVNLLNLRDESIANVLSVSDFEKGYLMFVTKLGIVKKISAKDVSKPRSTGVRVMNLPVDGSDTLISVMRVEDKQEVLLTTSDGKAIRFNSDDVRSMGRASYGVRGIELNSGDEVVSLVPVPIKDSNKTSILTVTNKGYGKRSALEDYRLTGRGGKGVINLKPAEKNGEVVRSLPVTEDSSIIATTKQGMIVRISMDELREMGRATQGVRVVKLKDTDKIADVVLVADEKIEI